jgi:hypothetical protein
VDKKYPEFCCCDHDEGEECTPRLVVSGRDAASVLQLVEQTLDQVAALGLDEDRCACSCLRRIAMICSSVNLARFIIRPLVEAGL